MPTKPTSQLLRDFMTETTERLARIEALAEAERDRRGGEIRVLFEKAKETADAVNVIKLDYTPRSEHEKTTVRVTRLEERSWKLAGVVALVVFVAQAFGGYIGQAVKAVMK